MSGTFLRDSLGLLLATLIASFPAFITALDRLFFQPFLWICFIIPFQKFSVYSFFGFFSGAHGIIDFTVGSKIICLAFESNLRDPFLTLFIPINAVMSACICADKTVASFFEQRNGCAVHKLHIVHDHFGLQAATAFRFSGQKVVLADLRFISALATAAPVIMPFPFSGTRNCRQITKPLSLNILNRRMSQTATAFFITMRKLRERCKDLLPAVTPAAPDCRSGRIPQLCGFTCH